MFNKIIMIGHLTRDVELRYLNTGTAVATVGLASNHRYKRQDGNYTEEACFVDITVFGRYAEVANQYLKKGSKILVEGRLKFDSWTDQAGQRRSKHSIVADSFEMLDSKQQGSDFNYQQNQGYTPQQTQGYNQPYSTAQGYSENRGYNQQTNMNNPSRKEQNTYQEPPEIDIDEEDLPF